MFTGNVSHRVSWEFTGEIRAKEKTTEDGVLENAMQFQIWAPPPPRVYVVCTSTARACVHVALYLQPSCEPREEARGHLAAKPQGAGTKQGRKLTSFSFIHFFTHSFLLPTGNVLVGLCPEAQGTVLLFRPGFLQINTGHRKGHVGSHQPGHHFSVHVGKSRCQHLKYLWPHRRESGQRLRPQRGLSKNLLQSTLCCLSWEGPDGFTQL